MRNERRLARRAAAGDREAFAAIFRRHQQDLYRYCVAILGDPDDAQDALQNTMVKALRALPGEQRELKLKPWLYRIAHNESIELRRRRRGAVPLAEEAPAPVSVEQSVADRARLRELLADLGRLPERHRAALVMRVGGLGFAEIGEALDTSPAAAKQVLYEARRGLHEMSEGREMRCDAVAALISEEDGRTPRRRDLRAHLRACEGCSRFAAEIRERHETLAGIAPLPAAAAAASLHAVLSASGGGGAAGVAGTGTGAVVGAAKAASTATILKSAAGVAAIVAIGAVAVDHGHLLHHTGASVPPRETASKAQRSSGDSGVTSPAATPINPPSERLANASRRNAIGRPMRGPVGLGVGDRTVVADSPGTDRPSSAPAEEPAAAPASTEFHRPQARGIAAGRLKRAAADHSAHPAHPEHPAHPQHPAKPEKGAHPEHLEEGSPASAGSPGAGETGATKEAAEATRPEHPDHPSTATVKAEPTATPAAAEPAAEATEGAEAMTPPGQAAKQAAAEAEVP